MGCSHGVDEPDPHTAADPRACPPHPLLHPPSPDIRGGRAVSGAGQWPCWAHTLPLPPVESGCLDFLWGAAHVIPEGSRPVSEPGWLGRALQPAAPGPRGWLQEVDRSCPSGSWSGLRMPKKGQRCSHSPAGPSPGQARPLGSAGLCCVPHWHPEVPERGVLLTMPRALRPGLSSLGWRGLSQNKLPVH